MRREEKRREGIIDREDIYTSKDRVDRYTSRIEIEI
jgi:hypothetical protein